MHIIRYALFISYAYYSLMLLGILKKKKTRVYAFVGGEAFVLISTRSSLLFKTFYNALIEYS